MSGVYDRHWHLLRFVGFKQFMLLTAIFRDVLSRVLNVAMLFSDLMSCFIKTYLLTIYAGANQMASYGCKND